MKTIRNILLLIIAAVVFLHGFVPHKHHGEMSAAEHKTAHQNADDLIDLLSLAFHNNLIGDLENYLIPDRIFLNRLSCGVSRYIVAHIPFEKNTSENTLRIFEAFQPVGFIRTGSTCNKLRAPPEAIITT